MNVKAGPPPVDPTHPQATTPPTTSRQGESALSRNQPLASTSLLTAAITSFIITILRKHPGIHWKGQSTPQQPRKRQSTRMGGHSTRDRRVYFRIVVPVGGIGSPRARLIAWGPAALKQTQRPQDSHSQWPSARGTVQILRLKHPVMTRRHEVSWLEAQGHRHPLHDSETPHQLQPSTQVKDDPATMH